MKSLLSLLLALLPLCASAKHAEKFTQIELQTTMGTMRLALYNATPEHRDNFKKLVKAGFYDGLLFHRVIDGFVVQAGDPDSRNAAPGQLLGEGNAGYTLPAEIRPEILHKHGSLAAAREGDDVNPERRSSSSQFYIALDHFKHLDGKYTVFGEVTDGIEVAEEMQKVKGDANNRPLEDVRIIRARVLRHKVKLESSRSSK